MIKKLLGINIDHIATVRQARGIDYPDPVKAALLAEKAGADGITLHLREDRRHIQDHDVERMKGVLQTRMNLEMAVTDEMISIAKRIKPAHICLVPEKREELTTEGGLDVVGHFDKVKAACDQLGADGMDVSLFIDADEAQIDAAIACGAPTIEIHTGHYAECQNDLELELELQRIKNASVYAYQNGLVVNAGHGLHYTNTQAIAAIPEINELNIGHSVIARAVFVGLDAAVREIKQIIDDVSKQK